MDIKLDLRGMLINRVLVKLPQLNTGVIFTKFNLFPNIYKLFLNILYGLQHSENVFSKKFS